MRAEELPARFLQVIGVEEFLEGHVRLGVIAVAARADDVLFAETTPGEGDKMIPGHAGGRGFAAVKAEPALRGKELVERGVVLRDAGHC